MGTSASMGSNSKRQLPFSSSSSSSRAASGQGNVAVRPKTPASTCWVGLGYFLHVEESPKPNF